jgi:hypothetical protein
LEEQFEDTKRVIRIRISKKNRKHNDKTKVQKDTKLENISIIPGDLETQLKNFSNSGLAGINFTQYDAIVSTCRCNLFHFIGCCLTSSEQYVQTIIK